jgi:hypothetical protein
MKTTIELADDLAKKAKRYAARHGITLRAVIEDGIRLKLRSEIPQTAFKLRHASVGGNGLQPEFRDQGWHKLRQAAYEDRGG